MAGALKLQHSIDFREAFGMSYYYPDNSASVGAFQQEVKWHWSVPPTLPLVCCCVLRINGLSCGGLSSSRSRVQGGFGYLRALTLAWLSQGTCLPQFTNQDLDAALSEMIQVLFPFNVYVGWALHHNFFPQQMTEENFWIHNMRSTKGWQ